MTAEPRSVGVRTLMFECFARSCLFVIYRVISLLHFLKFIVHKTKHIIRNGLMGSVKMSQDYSVPLHVAFVVADTPVSYKDLSKLLSWCFESRIYYVTLYDYEGYIKKSPDELFRLSEQLLNSAGTNCDINLHYNTADGHVTKRSMNGAANQLQIFLASSEDGREAIVDAARVLHSKKSRITIQEIDKAVNESVPEPDILVRCGGVHSHLGFPPWSLRLTEFFDLPSHKHLFITEFEDILSRFSKIDRRKGR